MARLLVHVEGHTERGFVEEILREHLVARGYHSVDARFVGNSRQRGGGIKNWPSVRKGILNHLRQDTDCVSTTLVDYYALPAGAERGWPGRAESSALATAEAKGRCVEDAIMGDLSGAVDLRRFVPFVMMHEFEGLLFSDCAAFSRAVNTLNWRLSSPPFVGSSRQRRISTIRRTPRPQSVCGDSSRNM